MYRNRVISITNIEVSINSSKNMPYIASYLYQYDLLINQIINSIDTITYFALINFQIECEFLRIYK